MYIYIYILYVLFFVGSINTEGSLILRGILILHDVFHRGIHSLSERKNPNEPMTHFEWFLVRLGLLILVD